MNVTVLGSGMVAREFCSLLKGDFRVVSGERPEWAKDFLKADVRKLKRLDTEFIVNTLPSGLNRRALELALNSNADYLDFATFSSVRPEHFDYKKEFLREGLSGIANAGLAPGMSNLLVAHADGGGYRDIELFMLEDGNSQKLSWNYRDFLYTISDRPVWVENGRMVKVGQYSHPRAFRGRKFYAFYADEALSLFYNLRPQNLRVRAGGRDIEQARQIFRKKSRGKKIGFPEKGPRKGGSYRIFVKTGEKILSAGFKRKEGNLIAGLAAGFGHLFFKYISSAEGLAFPEELPAAVQRRIIRNAQKQPGAEINI
ncbi:hypothetical protein GF318_05140 [Candidatus Micrarchaeota archaeon]|nr:hypothetical protein [Candidatus Micrarchaeota archaeon]